MAAFAATPTVAFAVDSDDVLFFLPFEDSTDAVIARGSAAAHVTGTAQYAAGVRGRCFVGDPQSLLSYALQDNCGTDEGTVAMWIQPQWPSDDDQFHHFFRASTGNHGGKGLNSLMLYKYFKQDKLSFYTSNGLPTDPSEGRTIAFRQPLHWKPGRWVHLAATWSSTLASTEMYLYIDGQRVGAAAGSVFVPDRAPEQFTIGGPKGSAATCFDDVLIFGRPLLAREIAALHAAYQRPQQPGPGELPFAPSHELPLRAHVLWARGQLVVEVDCRGARRELGSQPGRVQVSLDQAGRQERRTATTNAGGLAQAVFVHDELRPGSCTVAAHLTDAQGRTLRTGRIDHEIPARPAWLGNDLGRSEEVLPPWTPLQTTRGTVEVWGRKYHCQSAPLPSTVESQGRGLLRAPIAMTISARGQTAPLTAAAHSAPKVGPAAWQQQWSGRLGPLAAELTSRVEFDGFVRYDLELRPQGQAEFDRLEMHIPLRSETSTLYHHANGTWTDCSDAGAVGPVGWSKPLPFVPYVWIGDERGGLAWWSEENRAWHNAQKDRAIEIRHTRDGVDLVLHVVDTPTRLSEPVQLTFGFLATPVRPMPSGWRDWRQVFVSAKSIEGFVRNRNGEEGCRNIANLWQSHVGAFSYLPAEPEAMRRKVDLLRAAGWQTVISYFALNYTQTGTPDYRLAEREWRRSPYTENDCSYGSYASVCNASTWADFLVWAVTKTLDDTGTDGVYLDCCNPNFCGSGEHGCAGGRYPLLATRALLKRIYTVVKSKRGDRGFVYCHNSENNLLTSFAFCDLVLNGEQYNRKDLRTLDRAKFRAELCPQPYGVPAVLLPTLVKFQPAGREKMPGAEFLAFPLLHDVLCSGSWLGRDSQQLLRQIERVLRQFDVSQAEFLPYWSNARELQVAAGQAAVSAYLHGSGERVLLIVQSDAAAGGPIQLEFHGRLQRFRGADARESLDDRRLPWQDNRLVWNLPDRGVRVAVLTRRPQ